MVLTGLLNLVCENTGYRDVLAQVDQIPALQVIRSARPVTLAALAQDWDGPVIFITARVKRAYNVAEQLPVWLGADAPIYRFAEPTSRFYDRVPWDKEVIQSRIETLAALLDDDAPRPPVIVTSARALMQRTVPVNQFRRGMMTLEPGQRHAIDKLLTSWVNLGYEPATQVVETGTFSRRGGILDIYPLGARNPVRIDFFDDEIDTLRAFDPASQRTIEKIDRVQIVPAREALPEHGPPLAQHLAPWFETFRKEGAVDVAGILSDADGLEIGQAFPLIEHYLPYFYRQPVSLLDYAADNALIVLEEPDDLQASIEQIAEDAIQNREENRAGGQIAPDHPLPYLDWMVFSMALRSRQTLHMSSTASDDSTSTGHIFVPGGRFGGQLRPMLTQMRQRLKQGDPVVVVTRQAQRLRELWYEQDASAFIPVTDTLEDTPQSDAPVFIEGAMQEGWSLRGETNTVHLMTDAEIFGWSRPEPRRRKTSRSGRRAPSTDFSDWQEGSYIVHADYGIGQFAGMQHRTLDGTEREYLVLKYGGTDQLFVPIHQADRLTKYVGVDEKPPSLNRLGKAIEWSRVRKKAQRNAEEEARELLAIYAERATAAGHAFTNDSAWQHELEATFPYVETEDQLHALKEVKNDMEQSTPMDRLICGDVGYGKTEVALRAAFKAVTDGKQVAVLAPTTVLAQQHYETFSDRLRPFPVKVEMLSRFRSKGQQNRMLPEIAAGKVDILIGTHRILSNDVTFNDLGLVIIDEEQRFGVKHKEHFKKLRSQVDVLTLTATPIPRTLYMSLAGVRDISMIQTPPEERLPVMTHVGTFDEKLVRQAVVREIERGGQIFVVHNRVRTIDVVREKLERIVPEARIIVGHGQMTPRQLEQVMIQFAHGEYDILLSTSIIENGIDMPNVNTLIVDRADWFGMSQLYQLRGRVGRGAQQAYAYFFHGGGRKLTEEARFRLETLAEHTDLGAGFQIAMRDLELRGAGDILSMRQTGHVAAVGLHLYTQLLTRAIQKMKGADEGEPIPAGTRDKVVIDLPIPAYLPTDWIEEMALRLQIYRRIGSVQDAADIELIREELKDRFGQLPVAVEGLLYQMEVTLCTD